MTDMTERNMEHMAKKFLGKIYRYTVVFEPDEESRGYVVTVPALPGCVTQGDSLEEAVTMVKDAILAYLASLKKHHEPIPFESTRTIVKKIDIELPKKILAG